jgi:hypothetical protein
MKVWLLKNHETYEKQRGEWKKIYKSFASSTADAGRMTKGG